MLTEEFDYPLPEGAIAQQPIEPRAAARLLVDRGPDRSPDDRVVADLPRLLRAGDLLVVNATRVLPARLHLHKPTGGAVEVLLVEPVGSVERVESADAAGQSERVAPLGAADPSVDQPAVWDALVRPSRRVAAGTRLAGATGLTVVVEGAGRQDGTRRVRLEPPGATRVQEALAAEGEVPLPPYITAPLADPERYQTVYGRRPESVAAPTAGLHLTDELLAACAEAGVGYAEVELAVGLGTFRPITADKVEDHEIHTERLWVPPATLAACAATRAAGGRVVAVGTTAVRALESAAAGSVAGAAATAPEVAGRTDLFITRPYDWQVVDVLLTNFHLPRSSLLVLVDAFVGPRWRELYERALTRGYRFLSFGDAMLLERSQALDSSHGAGASA